MTAGLQHDITLTAGGTVYGFQIRKGSYQEERADDFAPRIATGNDPSLREGIWDVWSHNGAPGGIDQLTLVDRNRIYSSDGNVFLSRSERIMLQAAWNSSDAAVIATAPMFVDFTTASDLVAGGIGTKVRRYTAATGLWAASTSHDPAAAAAFDGNVVWLHQHGSYMFAALDNAKVFQRSTDLITWTRPAAGQAASCFTTWSKTNSDGTTTINLVLGTGATVKLSVDNGATWPTTLNVGNPDSNITSLSVGFGLLLIGKEDGFCYYDGVNVVEDLKMPNKKYVSNFRNMVYHEGFLYTHVLGEILKISLSGGGAANMTYITPNKIGSEAKELYGHGVPVAMWSGPSNLYVAFDDGESVYPEVLSYTGQGWQQEYLGTSGDTMYAGGYSRKASQTFINDGASRYRKHPTLRDLPFPDYPATGQYVTSDFDGGLPFMYKAFRYLQVEAENISSGKIKIEYSLDRGTNYVALESDVTVDGQTILTFPSAEPIASRSLRLRVTLYRNSSSSSPRLRRVAVSFINRPTPIYAFSLDLKLAGGQVIRDQTAEPESMDTLRSFLKGAEASVTPVTFTDMYSHAQKMYITKTRAHFLPERPMNQGGAVPPMELFVNVTMIGILTVGYFDAVYWDAFQWG